MTRPLIESLIIKADLVVRKNHQSRSFTLFFFSDCWFFSDFGVFSIGFPWLRELKLRSRRIRLCYVQGLICLSGWIRGIRVAGGFSIFTDFLIGLDKFLIWPSWERWFRLCLFQLPEGIKRPKPHQIFSRRVGPLPKPLEGPRLQVLFSPAKTAGCDGSGEARWIFFFQGWIRITKSRNTTRNMNV